MSKVSGPLYSDEYKEFIDAGKRASDIINGLITAHPWDDIKDKFVAIRIGDGSSDGVIYDTKADAVRHQSHEQQCAYVGFRNLVGGATPKEMAIYLKFNRDAYKAGMRLIDPDNQRNPVQDLLIPAKGYDEMRNRLAAAQALHAIGRSD